MLNKLDQFCLTDMTLNQHCHTNFFLANMVATLVELNNYDCDCDWDWHSLYYWIHYLDGVDCCHGLQLFGGCFCGCCDIDLIEDVVVSRDCDCEPVCQCWQWSEQMVNHLYFCRYAMRCWHNLLMLCLCFYFISLHFNSNLILNCANSVPCLIAIWVSPSTNQKI